MFVIIVGMVMMLLTTNQHASRWSFRCDAVRLVRGGLLSFSRDLRQQRADVDACMGLCVCGGIDFPLYPLPKNLVDTFRRVWSLESGFWRCIVLSIVLSTMLSIMASCS